MRRRFAIFLVLLGACAAYAAEAAKDILTYPIKQWGAVLGMSLLGGFAGWYAKVRKGEIPGHSLFALIGEMATSALSGLVFFLAADWAGAPLGLSAAIAGVSGYMGGRSIEMAEKVLKDKAARKFGSTGPAPLDEAKGPKS